MLVANTILAAVWWDAQLARWAVWGGLVLLTVALLLLIRTRWGQQPLGKCVVLSLLAHLLLAIYMTTVNIVSGPPGTPDGGGGVPVALVGEGTPEIVDESLAAEQWNAITGETDAPLEVPDLSLPVEAPPLTEVAEPKRATPTEPVESALTALPERLAIEHAPAPQLIADNEPLVRPASSRPQPTELPAETGEGTDLVPPPDQPSVPLATVPRKPAGDPPGPSAAQASGGPSTGGLAANQVIGPGPLPKVFEGRAGNHLGPLGNGASKETEDAVKAALHWLATNQSPNGRWDPRRLDAASGLAADGEDRQFAGAHADTGLSGLALLSFLASGHTHLNGEYRDNVRRGLEFLLASQDATGNLGATNNTYERMYCHAMACCALSEAYAMTRDQRMLPSLRLAIQYTLRTQDRPSGSWRYLVGQPGDTSQLGWQVMSLKSAELGGLAIPAETRSGMERFLRSVSSGRYGGLACYQPTRPLVTRSMTAEAMACRQFLGNGDRVEMVREASDLLLQEPPGLGQTNHYYWYYATLALHQAGGEPWRRWNESLQKTLLATQRTDGSWAGSWDPDPVWGRCGGRVYSTSLCALCLEVYYRYLPLYVETAGRNGAATGR